MTLVLRQDAGIKDAYLVDRPVHRARADALDVLDGVHTVNHTTKHDVTAVEPRCLYSRDEN